jgi:hypothetical protein
MSKKRSVNEMAALMHERFEKDLARLNPRKHGDMQCLRLDHLYGKSSIPDSYPTLVHGYSDSRKRPYPFILGEDARTAVEIYRSLEPLVIDRANEMLKNDVVRQPFDEKTDYLGKLEKYDVFIAKEIVLPKRFRQEVFKHEHVEGKGPIMTLSELVRSGQLFVDIEKSEKFDQKLMRILQKEGMEISDMTLVDVSAWAKRLSYSQSIELMEIIAEPLKNRGYELKRDLPWLNPSHWGKNERAYVTVSQLRNCTHLFVGEAKIVESSIPYEKRGKFVKRTGKRKDRNEYEESLSRIREFSKTLWAAAGYTKEKEDR